MSIVLKPIILWCNFMGKIYNKLAEIISIPSRHLFKMHKVPNVVIKPYLGEKKEIMSDYRRIGKDYYEALNIYEKK